MPAENLKYKTKTGLYWTVLKQFSNYGLSFLVGIIMARLLSPEDFGITALPAIFFTVATIFQDAGLGAAIVRKPDITDEDLCTAFYYSTGVGILIYIILFFSSPYIADFYNTPILTPMIRISSLAFIWGPLGTPQGVLLSRRLDFKTPTIIAVSTKIFSAIVGISLAYMGYGLWSLVFNGLLGGLFGLILTWWVVRWLPQLAWSKESFKYLFGFGSRMALTNIIYKISQNITPAVIGKFFSPTELGIYNRALGYASLPSENVVGTINTVTFPILSKIQDDNLKMGNAYRRMLRTSAFIVFPMMLMLAVLAHPLILVMITSKWEACVPYLQVMCVWLMFSPIHGLNCQLLMVKGRTDILLRIEIVKTAIFLTMMFLTLPYGIMHFLYGSIVHSILCLAINTYYTGKLINVGFLTQIGDIIPVLIVSVISAVSAYYISMQFENNLLRILFGGIVGALMYLGICSVSKFSEIKDVLYLLNKKR